MSVVPPKYFCERCKHEIERMWYVWRHAEDIDNVCDCIGNHVLMLASIKDICS